MTESMFTRMVGWRERERERETERGRERPREGASARVMCDFGREV